jgi:hypothetical protein
VVSTATNNHVQQQVNPVPPPSPEDKQPFDQFDVAMGYDHNEQDFEPAPIPEGPAVIKIKVKKVKDKNSVSYGILI